jgi:hypothetical protein
MASSVAQTIHRPIADGLTAYLEECISPLAGRTLSELPA